MSNNRVAERRARTRNKVLALSAAGAVLAAGITIPSLAAWTDIEWIAGSADGTTGGVGTQTFEVEQLTAANAPGDWDHYETQGDANYIDFSDAAAALTPGDTVYAWVQLRTEAGSLGGELSLASDVVLAGDPLAAALRYGVRFVPTTTACDAGGFATAGGTPANILVASNSLLTAGGADSFTLDAGATSADPGEAVTLCFQLTLPSSESNNSAIMGQETTPIWHFDATSVATP